MSSTPLDRVSDDLLPLVAGVIWDWETCDDCQRNAPGKCISPNCPTHTYNRLTSFLVFLKAEIAAYRRSSRNIASTYSILQTYDDLVQLIQIIKNNPDSTKADIIRIAFPATSNSTAPLTSEEERAINLAANIMTMASCAPSHQAFLLLEHGRIQLPWQVHSSLGGFMSITFPISVPSVPSSLSIDIAIKHSLSASKLKRKAHIRLEPTDDLASHLRLNRRDRTLQIYHHCGFLKQNLRVTKEYGTSLSISEYLKMGCIPRQLALETLDSIQNILFPHEDQKSRAMLENLISTHSWDPECSTIPSPVYRRPEENNIPYLYFGHRLLELYDEVSDPGPRTAMGKWLDRKKGSRHVMLATLTGVVIAIVLGMLTLGVSGYQAWLGYQQWQHPKQDQN